jgi:hypothetical protein
MTTARYFSDALRETICEAKERAAYSSSGNGWEYDFIAALLSAPEPVRLELAWQLCPELRYPGWEAPQHTHHRRTSREYPASVSRPWHYRRRERCHLSDATRSVAGGGEGATRLTHRPTESGGTSRRGPRRRPRCRGRPRQDLDSTTIPYQIDKRYPAL